MNLFASSLSNLLNRVVIELELKYVNTWCCMAWKTLKYVYNSWTVKDNTWDGFREHDRSRGTQTRSSEGLNQKTVRLPPRDRLSIQLGRKTYYSQFKLWNTFKPPKTAKYNLYTVCVLKKMKSHNQLSFGPSCFPNSLPYSQRKTSQNTLIIYPSKFWRRRWLDL